MNEDGLSNGVIGGLSRFCFVSFVKIFVSFVVIICNREEER